MALHAQDHHEPQHHSNHPPIKEESMKATRTLLGLLLASAVAALAVAPAAQGAMFDRITFVDFPYAFEEQICGIDVQVEGTVSGHSNLRTGRGRLDTAFFEHTNAAYSETWTAANGRSVTVTGNANFNEVKAVPLGGSLFRFTQVEAGQPFRLYDAQGNLLLRDRGAIRFTVVFDTLGDDTPGGIVIEELEPGVRGPHPGFDDATLCPVLVPELTA
jgi:hypothetical protein